MVDVREPGRQRRRVSMGGQEQGNEGLWVHDGGAECNFIAKYRRLRAQGMSEKVVMRCDGDGLGGSKDPVRSGWLRSVVCASVNMQSVMGQRWSGGTVPGREQAFKWARGG